MSYGETRYSGFRYGQATRGGEDAGEQRGARPSPDVISPEEAYGSGLKLATNDDIEAGRAKYPFDLVIDDRGALATISGLPYLLQGIALRFVGAASQLVGEVFDEQQRARLELDIRGLAANDDRVRRVPSATIQQIPTAPNALEVTLQIVAVRAVHDAIFTVEPPATPPS